MDTPLAGQTALVTGAARGIGRTYALRLAQLGADVAVLDADLRSYTQYEAEARGVPDGGTAAEVEMLGRRSMAFEVDVTDSEAMAAAAAQIDDEWGRLDILVCNAGGGSSTPEETKASIVSPEDVDLVVQRNLTGTINTCRVAVPLMKRHGYGRIVTISSQAGRVSSPGGGYSHYGAAKAGIQMYTRYLAQEVGEFGITANCIAPGYIATGRLDVMFERIGKQRLESQVALRRLGTPDDCANVLQFLVTELSGYVTGAIVPVDGGSVP